MYNICTKINTSHDTKKKKKKIHSANNSLLLIKLNNTSFILIYKHFKNTAEKNINMPY